ncbi:hypothetical protein RF11_09927 [Thelohanellus kitauei]|uniref:Uncharacterized protein n=1 Tax=Thelohanellus kitauei TaxID=669202 RepID=A0A0C2IYR8_THEKT|nr:hypothetical protein RF11_09927 [Thelohanellus kitauei]
MRKSETTQVDPESQKLSTALELTSDDYREELCKLSGFRTTILSIRSGRGEIKSHSILDRARAREKKISKKNAKKFHQELKKRPNSDLQQSGISRSVWLECDSQITGST